MWMSVDLLTCLVTAKRTCRLSMHVWSQPKGHVDSACMSGHSQKDLSTQHACLVTAKRTCRLSTHIRVLSRQVPFGVTRQANKATVYQALRACRHCWLTRGDARAACGGRAPGRQGWSRAGMDRYDGSCRPAGEPLPWAHAWLRQTEHAVLGPYYLGHEPWSKLDGPCG